VWASKPRYQPGLNVYFFFSFLLWFLLHSILFISNNLLYTYSPLLLYVHTYMFPLEYVFETYETIHIFETYNAGVGGLLTVGMAP
jgi:hypothetical protein